MIFPKKEILYAPMIGTLGGGSMRSFGRGTGGGGLYDFSEGLHLVPQDSVVTPGQDHRFGMYNFNEYRPDLVLGGAYTAPYLTVGATSFRDDGYKYITNGNQFGSQPFFTWWTVPYTGSYNFICRGAQGGRPYNYWSSGEGGGAGANLQGTFDATEGDIYYICVGLNFGNHGPSAYSNQSYGHGGGGASFIAKGTAVLSANAANASGTDRAPVVVAGGGGGTAGYNWIGSSSQAQGLNASIEVANNSDNGYWSNEATRNDSHAHVPYAQHSMVVNTVAGGGGFGGNGQNLQTTNLSGAISKRFYQANPSQGAVNQSGQDGYNGTAGGAGWLQTGSLGANSSVGGTRLYDNSSGGNSSYTRGEGGMGGGGGARNTSGGGGGGYIGGSGGIWSGIGWSNGGGGGIDAYGGFGGTSYCNYNFVTSVTATQGPRSNLAENFGRVQIWPN